MLFRIAAGLGLVIVLGVATGGAASAVAGQPQAAGAYHLVEGRKVRLVCDGPSDAAGPMVWLEAGAYGMAEDLSEVQRRLSLRGLRSCAWDRAGLGLSDPGPLPRDGEAILRDRDAVMAAAGVRGPFVVVAHSMAGLSARLWAARRPEQVVGLVLLDAAGPEAAQVPGARVWIDRFRRLAKTGAALASLGLMKPASWFVGDRIGLEPDKAAVKRWAVGSAKHHRAAAAEISAAFITGEQAQAAGDIPVDMPVAVITAGSGEGAWKEMQAAPARRSQKGSYLNLEGATHNSMLGRDHADAVVAAVLRVIADRRTSS